MTCLLGEKRFGLRVVVRPGDLTAASHRQIGQHYCYEQFRWPVQTPPVFKTTWFVLSRKTIVVSELWKARTIGWAALHYHARLRVGVHTD